MTQVPPFVDRVPANQGFLCSHARKRANTPGPRVRASASSRAVARRAHARSRVERVGERGFQYTGTTESLRPRCGTGRSTPVSS